MEKTIVGQTITEEPYQLFRGSRSEKLITQLAERLAHGQSSVRVFDFLIAKFRSQSANFSTSELEMFRDQKKAHARILQAALERSERNPQSYLSRYESTNRRLESVLTDPTTNLTQSVQAVLIAELADQVGWRDLLALSSESDSTMQTQELQQAFAEKEQHLRCLGQLLETLLTEVKSPSH